MRRHAVVTGAAGFIGSALSEALIDEGWHVLGVDKFSDYYDPAVKRFNLQGLSSEPRFDLLESNVGEMSAATFAALGTDTTVFHLAGQPGVRGSWSTGFDTYVQENITETQRLLEAVTAASVRRFVFASSSSIYGDATVYPTPEQTIPAPVSPYGVTKQSGELLVSVYRARGLDALSLRLFTVYGPRQRPDMAFYRLCEFALGRNPEFSVFGTGNQVRDFTFVSDVVRAFLLAGSASAALRDVYNVAGGSSTSLAEAAGMIQATAGVSLPLAYADVAAGDVSKTGGDTTMARRDLGWAPVITIAEGLRAQLSWHRDRPLIGESSPAVQETPR